MRVHGETLLSLCTLFALFALILAIKLRHARQALAEALERAKVPSGPPPPRVVESRRESFGLLWYPTLTVKDDERTIVAAAAGVPHCKACVQPLSLLKGPPEEWACSGCQERRPPTAADIHVTDSVIAECVQEFLARNRGYRAAGGLPQLKRPA